jgi:putative hydrolase of the HAD superfamily
MPFSKPIRAVTLDLDDTLWPIYPTIIRAETLLHVWLAEHAPATAQAHTISDLRRLREQLGAERPDLAHDLSALRLESIRRALAASGDDPALAEPAFAHFFAERQRVELYEDARPALARIAARLPVVALSNGNADLRTIGLDHHFVAAVSAREFGVGKPDPAIFLHACERAGFAPDEVLHVGDDPHLDVLGAQAAGQPAAWVDRGLHRAPEGFAPQLRVTDMAQLADRLGV